MEKIEFNKPIVRRKKLNEKEIDELVKLAENKPTSIASSRKLAKEMKRRGITISKSSICTYLNERLGKPRKIKPVFALNDKNKIKRVEYCQKLIDNHIIGKNIFFTDETQIKCEYAKNKKIRLSTDNIQKLKKGDPEVLKLMERDKEKFPKSIMLAGGISYYGLSDLMIVEGTMNEFAYAQAILLYKENVEEFKKMNKNIIFEQDGATCHTSKANKKLLNLIFGKKGWIQNSPSSPDLAYPIETVWAELKDKVGNRNPKTYEELKNYCIEEWNKIEPRKYFKNFEEKIKLCKELNGERLNEFKLREIRKKAEEETEIELEGKKEGNIVEKKLKRVFNEKVLIKLKEKEIKSLPKKEKDTAKYYDEKIKDLNNKIADKKDRIKYKKDFKKNTGKDLDNVNDEFELELLKIEMEKNVKAKEKKLRKISEKIEEIPKMTIVQYLRYHLEQEEIERKKIKID